MVTQEEKTKKLVSNLPTFMQLDSDSNNYKFLNSFSPELNVTENNVVLLKTSLHIDEAIGDDLDNLGKLFGLFRNDEESDSSFRGRIKAFFQTAIKSGSEIGLKESLANALGIEDVIIKNVTTLEDEFNIFNTGSGTTAKVGPKITPKEDILLSYVKIKATSGSATKAYIYEDVSGILLGKADIISDIARFSSPIALKSGVVYRAVVDSEGTSYNTWYRTIGISYPYVGTYLDITGAYANLASIDTFGIDIHSEQDSIDIITVQNNIFDLNIAINADSELDIFNKIREIVEVGKAAGMYFRNFDLVSENNIFMTEISYVDGVDLIL